MGRRRLVGALNHSFQRDPTSFERKVLWFQGIGHNAQSCPMNLCEECGGKQPEKGDYVKNKYATKQCWPYKTHDTELHSELIGSRRPSGVNGKSCGGFAKSYHCISDCITYFGPLNFL